MPEITEYQCQRCGQVTPDASDLSGRYCKDRFMCDLQIEQDARARIQEARVQQAEPRS